MERFIQTLLFALTIPLTVSSIAKSPSVADTNKTVPAGTPSDAVDVQHVIDSYHEAVLAHDGSRLSSLFLPQGGMCLNVLSVDALLKSEQNRQMRQRFVSEATQISQRWFRTQKPASIRPTRICN